MGLFGALSEVGKAAVNIATLPVTGAYSVITSEVALEDDHAVGRNFDRLKGNLKKAADNLK